MAVAHSSATTSALGGATDRLGDPPALPVRDAARLVPQCRTRHVDAEHLAGVGHEEVPGPLGERRSSRSDRVLRLDGAVEGPELRLGEADEEARPPWKRRRGPSQSRHAFWISQSREQLTAPGGVAHTVSTGHESPPGPPSSTAFPHTEEVNHALPSPPNHYHY